MEEHKALNPPNTQHDRFLVKPGSQLELREIPTKISDFPHRKATAEVQLQVKVKQLSLLQQRLYAEGAQSLLIIFQGMDASGKDGTIRHLTTGVNPAGVQVHSYGVPTKDDLVRSYLQRHWQHLPAHGYIGVQNRSHYEEVVVTRVHPSVLHMRNIHTDDVDDVFWHERFKDICNFERHLVRQNRTKIVKIFLHISKHAQLKRLVSRLDDPNKRWKFDINDLRERMYWNEFQSAYNEAISATATDFAPWYVVPADKRYVARLAVAEIVVEKLTMMDPQIPSPHVDLKKLKEELLKT